MRIYKNLLINYFFIILSFLFYFSIFLFFFYFMITTYFYFYVPLFFFLDKSLKNEQNIKQKIK